MTILMELILPAHEMGTDAQSLKSSLAYFFFFFKYIYWDFNILTKQKQQQQQKGSVQHWSRQSIHIYTSHAPDQHNE